MINWLLLPCLAAGLAQAQARAMPRPEAEDVLRRSLELPDTPYAAEFTVSRHEGGADQAASSRMMVRFSPPNLYRRELLFPSGEIRQLIVEDGRGEWIYDPARRKVWQGETADPLFKRFGPDEEFDRLSENYGIALATGAKVAGRPTWLLELRSRDGALARRLWVERHNYMVLRNESFAPDGSLTGYVACDRIKWGQASSPESFHFIPPAGSTVVKRLEPDYLALDEAKSALGAEPRLPAWLPSGYVFESLDLIPKGRRNVVHYRFSDGLNVVSLFQCPPRVRFAFGGRARKRVKLSAGRGYRTETAEGNVLVWNSGGWRFILIAPVSSAALKRMAESVP